MSPKWTLDEKALRHLADEMRETNEEIARTFGVPPVQLGPAHAALDDQAANRPGHTGIDDHQSLARPGLSGGSGQSSDVRPGQETYASHHRIARPGGWQPADELDAQPVLDDRAEAPEWARRRAERYLMQLHKQRRLDEIDAQRRREIAEDAERNRPDMHTGLMYSIRQVEGRAALIDEIWQWSAAYGVERFDPLPPAPVKPGTAQRVARRTWWFAMGAGIGYLLWLAIGVFTDLGSPWPWMVYMSLHVGFIASRTGLKFKHRTARYLAVCLVFGASLGIDRWLM